MKPARLAVLLPLLAAPALRAQEPPADFEQAAASVRKQLEDSLAELAALRERMAAESVPQTRRLGELEAELTRVRQEFQQAARALDGRNQDLGNLRGEIRQREDEAAYLSNLLGEYGRQFEARLHIAELQRYAAPLEAARLAPENDRLGPSEVFGAQAGLVSASLDRLEDALGGARFDGTAVDAAGMVQAGTFLLVGPAALFRSADGAAVGTAEQRLGSLEPTVFPFADPLAAEAAARAVLDASGAMPFDPTLGDAHKIAATEETLWEHVRKGGPVMVPILGMAALALLVALFKWIALAFQPKPSRKRVRALLDAVGRCDRAGAREAAAAIRGPAGRMLAAGVEHLDEPRELIEEVMYESVLTTRLKTQRFLPFIAICAASAPLLGLLGTVTGIINTFKMITVFGSGDVKSLSGGISEALITTEFGLIVAIPALLLHAFLSRKARGVVAEMEAAAVAFANQAGRTPAVRPANHAAADPAAVRAQVQEILRELLDPVVA